MKQTVITLLNKLPYISKLQARIDSQHQLIKSYGLTRQLIASYYVKGEGIEIGALHKPLPVDTTTRVKYVDRMSVDGLRKQYPELKDLPLVEADYIADGEKLETIEDSSQDFVIANHFIEHCQTPILAIQNMLRVLKKGGIIYMAIPDKRYTFDINRPVTPIEHLLKDYEEGPEWSKRQHFEEWVTLVDKVQGQAEIEQKVEYLLNIDYSIHYHVWTMKEMQEWFLFLKNKLAFPFDIVFSMLRPADMEALFILRKSTD